MSYPRITLLSLLGVMWLSMPATAQPLGTFRWQLLPYCNVLTLNVIQQGGIYTLDGTDDGCGAAHAASAAGIAKIIFIVALILAVISFVAGRRPAAGAHSWDPSRMVP